jgi:hypothetical protein
MKTNRLIISGFACPKEPWEEFLGDKNHRIITFAEILKNTPKTNFLKSVNYVKDQIKAEKPNSIICHDFGTFLTLMALLKLKKENFPLEAKLTVFNGAFRGFDVLVATHPFKIQLMNYRKLKNVLQRAGAGVDPSYEELLPRVKNIYRQIILMSLINKFKDLFKTHKDLNIDLGLDVQIIASKDDPFVPFSCMDLIGRDFKHRRFLIESYGHFPYITGKKQLRELVHEFEEMPLVTS